MKFEEEYREIFSQLHSSVEVRWEDFGMKSAKMRGRKYVRAGIIAACLVAVMSTLAFAAHMWSLRDLAMPDEAKPQQQDAALPEDHVMLSLQGFTDTAEYQAAVEWRTYTASYDADGSLLDQIGNGPTGRDEKYSLYTPYTQEMADRLDEITQKYGLALHQSIQIIQFRDEWQEFAGGDFFGPENILYGGYGYNDGTFQYDGYWYRPDADPVDYQFRRSVKGCFDETVLNIGDIASYEEWGYTTDEGVEVTLALGDMKALIIADRPESFVAVNVLAGSDALTKTDLEQMADSFDFSVLA